VVWLLRILRVPGALVFALLRIRFTRAPVITVSVLVELTGNLFASLMSI
jgi:hypothetical protein